MKFLRELNSIFVLPLITQPTDHLPPPPPRTPTVTKTSSARRTITVVINISYFNKRKAVSIWLVVKANKSIEMKILS